MLLSELEEERSFILKNYVDACARIEREKNFCSMVLYPEDDFVRTGRGENLCSIRLDLLDAFVRIGRGEPSSLID